MSAHTASAAIPRRGRGLRGALLTLLLALVLAVWILVSQDHWAFRADLLPFTISWVLAPGSGLLPLTLALWLMVEVPRRFLRRSRGAVVREEAGAAPAPALSAVPVDPSEQLVDHGEEAGAQAGLPPLRIPSGTFRELGAQHRWEMAEALGIPWRDELIHDHQSWAVACLEAAQRRAADPAG